MPSVASDPAVKVDVNPSASPDTSTANIDGSINSPKGNELDDLRRSMREFKDETVTVAQDRHRGAVSNLHSIEKDIHESGWLSRISGNTAALEKQREADQKMVEQRKEKAELLDQALKQTEALVKQYDEKLEIIKQREKQFLEKQAEIEKELETLEGKDAELNKKLEEQVKLQEEYLHEMETLRAQADVIKETALRTMAIDATVDTTAYMASLHEVNASLEQGIKTLDNIEATGKVVHTGCVVVAATAITIGTAGAGAGIGGAMIAGTLGGTALGAATNSIEAAGHVARGNKTSGEAWRDAGSQTWSDAKTAAQAAASAAMGGGLANSSAVTSVVGAKGAQYVVAPALVQAGNTAFTTSSEIMAARGEYAKYIQSPEFAAKEGGTPAQLGKDYMEVVEARFFKERGLDWGTIAKNGVIDMTVAVAGSAIGAKVNPGGAQSITGKIIRTGVEGGVDIGLGTGAALLKGEELSYATVAQQAQNAVVGRVVSASVGSVQPVAAGSAQKNFEATPEGAGKYRTWVNDVNAKVVNGVAGSVSTAKYEQAAIGQIAAASLLANDYAREKLEQGAGVVKEKVQEGLSAAAAKGKELADRVRGIEATASDAAATVPTAKPAESKTADANIPADETKVSRRPQWNKVRDGGAPDFEALKAAAIEHQKSGKGPFRISVSNVDDLPKVRELKNSLPKGSIVVGLTKDAAAQVNSAHKMLEMGVNTEYNKQLATWKVREPERFVAKSPQEAGAALESTRKALENSTSKVELKITDPESFKQNMAELKRLATDPEFKGRLQIRGSKEVVDFINESKAIVANPVRDPMFNLTQAPRIEAAQWRSKPVDTEPSVYKLRRNDDTQVAGASATKTRDDSRQFHKGGSAVPESRVAAKTRNNAATDTVAEQA